MKIRFPGDYRDAPALQTPPAPTLSVVGGTGTTSYSYYVVARDWAGKQSAVSAVATITTGPATLSSSNYINISWTPIDDAVTYDVLKSGTSTAIATGLFVNFCQDTGQATSSYTAPTSNQSGAQQFSGPVEFQNSMTLDSGQTFTNNGTIAGGTIEANVFLAKEGTSMGGTAGFSFQGDGNYDTGMFSSGDGVLYFYANNVEIMSINSTSITNVKPTTFSGAATFNSGMTLASGQTFTNNGTISGGTINASSVPWSGVSSKPTTISGYGITDALAYTTGATFTGAVALNAGGSIASGQTLTNNGTITGGTINASSVPWSGVSSKPTTISGYGITDSLAYTTGATFSGNVEVDASLYFKSSSDNTDPTYITKNDVANDVSELDMYVGDNGSGTAIAQPSAGDHFAIKSTNIGIHHLFGTDGSAVHAGTLTVNGATALNGGGTIASGQTLTNNGTITGGTINASSVPWTGVSSHPTTISGYGITDALAYTTGASFTGAVSVSGGALTASTKFVLPVGTNLY